MRVVAITLNSLWLTKQADEEGISAQPPTAASSGRKRIDASHYTILHFTALRPEEDDVLKIADARPNYV